MTTFSIHNDTIMCLTKDNVIDSFLNSDQYDDYIGCKIQHNNFDGTMPNDTKLIKYNTMNELYYNNEKLCGKFTGTLSYDNGTVTYVNGIKHGPYDKRNESGNYVNGEKDGEWKDRANICTFENGVLNGISTHYDGYLSATGNYVNGKKEGIWTLKQRSSPSYSGRDYGFDRREQNYENGILKSIVTYKNKLETTFPSFSDKVSDKVDYRYTHDDKIVRCNNVIIEKHDSHWSYYYTNNILRHKVLNSKDNGCLHTYYYENGRIKSSETGFGGYLHRDKEKISYYPNDRVKDEYLIDKSFKRYYEDGILEYHYDIVTGEEKKFDSVGNIIESITIASLPDVRMHYEGMLYTKLKDGNIIECGNFIQYKHSKFGKLGQGERFVSRNSFMKIGEYKYFHDNGSIKCIENYTETKVGCTIDHRKNGSYIEYHENGNKKMSGTYVNDNKVGKWLHYDKDENIIDTTMHIID
jgi:antitoxin component YwqK of YwqJK toxin-antitoxin module